MEQIPPLIHADRMPPKQILAKKPLDEDAIADLDSPSLSDTQVNPNICPRKNTGNKIINFRLLHPDQSNRKTWKTFSLWIWIRLSLLKKKSNWSKVMGKDMAVMKEVVSQ